MKKASVFRILVIYFIVNIFSNVAHPITPTMFIEKNYPDYMYGVAFATMSTALFLTSPFWGSLGDNIGHSKIMAIAVPVYGLAQFGFGMTNSMFLTILFRFIAGSFMSGFNVGSLAYLVNLTTSENRGKYISYFVAIHSVASAFGFFVGGMVGEKSITAVFTIQTLSLIAAGILIYLFVGEKDNTQTKTTYNLKINPFSSFKDSKNKLNNVYYTLMIGVFFTSFATTAYDNAFNYFLKEALNLTSRYNGIFKAIIGIGTLIVNFTINIYILRKTDSRKSIIVILSLCAASSFTVVFVENLNLFFVLNLIFFMFNAIYMPIQQDIVTRDQDAKTSGIMLGIFNSVRSLGMIFGSLFAGFIYSFGSLLPFVAAAIAFILSTIISYVNLKQFYKEKVNCNVH